MATLIDASVLIAAERGKLDLGGVLNTLAEEDFMLAAITASELLHGLHRATKAQQRNRREAFVEALLAQFPVIAFDLLTARIHARMSAQLASRGIAPGAHDLLIAATAVSVGASVATRDERSFPRIPGISVIRW